MAGDYCTGNDCRQFTLLTSARVLVSMTNNVHLILGGARSGKSSFAEKIAHETGKEVVYIATATRQDDEMQDRIDRHKSDRPEHWITVEEPLELAQVVQHYSGDNVCILIDCLTLWLTNILMQESDIGSLEDYKTDLLAVLTLCLDSSSSVILVSNEVGQGIVPLGELSRRFVDEAGWLHQDIAAMADQVTFVVAGLPMTLK